MPEKNRYVFMHYMNKKRKQIKNQYKLMGLSILLAVIVCMMDTRVFAADSVTLDIGNGSITITDTGYTQGEEEIPYTGSYILTGTSRTGHDYITINGVSEGASITLKNLDITTQGPNCINIYAGTKENPVVLNATGTVSFTNNLGTAVYCKKPFVISGDANIILKADNAKIATNVYNPAEVYIDITCNSITSTGLLGNSNIKVSINSAKDIELSNSSNSAAAVAGNIELTSGGDVVISNEYNGESGSAVSGSIRINKSNGIFISNNSTKSAAIGQINFIDCVADFTSTGDVVVENKGSGTAVEVPLDIEALDVEIKSFGSSPTISKETVITANGNVTIENMGTHSAVYAPLTVNRANNVTIAVADNAKGSAVMGNTQITATGDAAIKGGELPAVDGDLVINNSKSISVTNNSSRGTITGNAALISTGNVSLINNGTGNVAGNKLDITADGNVMIKAACEFESGIIYGNVTMNANEVLLWNEKGNVFATNTTFQYTNKAGLRYAVYEGDTADNLKEYVTKEKDETYTGDMYSKVNAKMIKIAPKLSVIRIESNPAKTEYLVGEELDLTDAVLYYADEEGNAEVVDITENMVSGFDNMTAGTQTITVSYKEMTVTFEVTVVQATSLSPAAEAKVNAFVSRLYTYVLGRKAERAGLEAWSNVLISQESNSVDVGYGFVFSGECIDRGLSDEEFVEILYMTFMDRPSDEGGKAAWVSQLAAGVDREKVFEGFVMSDEFKGICTEYGITLGLTEDVPALKEVLELYRNQNADITKFVSRCYTMALGRGFDVEGLEGWCKAIITGENTPREVAGNGFFASDEFKAKNLSDEEFVKVLYRTFFDREADEMGLNGWVNTLVTGEQDRESILSGFTESDEFKEILESFGLN